MPRITSDLDETVRQLEELHRPRREQIARDQEALRAIVAGLGVPWGEDEEPIPGPSRRRPDEPRRPAQPGAFDAPELPRPREGHAYGPAVEAKLREEALRKGGW